MNLDRGTVRRWLRAEAFPEPAPRRRQGSKLDPSVPYLKDQVAAERHNATQLWRELRDQHQFTGSRRLVSTWVAAHRSDGLGLSPATARRQLSPRHAAWLLMSDPDTLTTEDERFVQRLCEAEPEMDLAYQLAQTFKQVVWQRRGDELPRWLLLAAGSGVREFQAFAAGIGRDYGAVRAALRLPYSTGPVEGHINRLKMIKGDTYGRAHHDSLRHRVLAA